MGFLGWIRLCVGIDSCLEILFFFCFFLNKRRDRGSFFSKVWIFFLFVSELNRIDYGLNEREFGS